MKTADLTGRQLDEWTAGANAWVRTRMRVERECEEVCANLRRRGLPPASELTDQERVALAVTCGADWRIDTIEGRIHIIPLIGIADRPEGGYLVAIQQHRPGDTLTVRL